MGERRHCTSLARMHTLVIDHPLVAHKMSRLRREQTSSATFRLLTEELVTLLAYEATRGLEVGEVAITTPVSPTTGREMSEPLPLVVPILRAGLGMLNGMMRLMPTAEVGFPLQNFFYAIQWWVFALFAVTIYIRWLVMGNIKLRK